MDELKAEFIDAGRLTRRQADVARLMAEGHGDKAIARLLAMSIKTVQVHTTAVYEKLGLHSAEFESNASGLNMRVRALGVMVAKGMVSLSVKVVVLILVGYTAVPDSDSLRIRSVRHRGRCHVHANQSRRASDA